MVRVVSSEARSPVWIDRASRAWSRRPVQVVLVRGGQQRVDLGFGEVGDDRTVAEFAYDWRLPVAHNAMLLASFAERHLAAWWAHPAQQEARRVDRNPDHPARLVVVVAHSMGGLLARHLCGTPGLAEEVRATVTLGTPFFGVPKAVLLLASGQGVRCRERRPGGWP